MPRWFRSLVVVILHVALLLAGCERTSETSSTEPVTLELWTLALRPRFTAYMEDLVADYEAAHPNVRVRWVDVPYDAMTRKFIAAAAAKRSPDVVNLADMQVARFGSLGGIDDLTGLLPGDPDVRYLPGAFFFAKLDSGVRGLPWYITTSARFSNRAMLAEGGLTPETLGRDWATLRAQAVEYKRRTGKHLFSMLLGQESGLPILILADGLNPFKTRADGTGIEANLTDDRIVKLVGDWVECFRGGALPRESAIAGHAVQIEMYQNRRIAVLETGANMLERIRDAAPDVFEQTAVDRATTGALGRQPIAVMFVSVCSTTKHPKEAADLAWFITSPENQLAFCKIVNILPSTPASLDDPHFQMPPDRNDKLAVARAYSAEGLKTGVAFAPAMQTWPELRKSFEDGIKSALLDGKDVRATLAEIERDWNRILSDAPPVDMSVVPMPGKVTR
jgi:putative chitobiose transport system substrate-binding protein